MDDTNFKLNIILLFSKKKETLMTHLYMNSVDHVKAKQSHQQQLLLRKSTSDIPRINFARMLLRVI